MGDIEKRKVLVGVSGSIAAYKSAELVRILTVRGYEVRVVMTEAAQRFISPETFEALTGHPVITDFWNEAVKGIGHIQMADWADAFVVAPASADTIAKLAAGSAENPLLAIALATKAELLIAPAMNVNMWEHPATQNNCAVLKGRGAHFVEPEEGELACGWIGSGRLASPWEIFNYVRRALSDHDYAGKRVVISTGPTREAIDPVRFISNRSSGKMGAALAREAFRRGADVTLVHGPVAVQVPSGVHLIPVMSALDMKEAVINEAFHAAQPADLVIMAAAVADYRPAQVASYKIKKGDASPSLELVHNPDILAELGKTRGKASTPSLVGFAVETGEVEDLLESGRKKLAGKCADMIVANFAQEALELDTNRVWLIDKNGKQSEVATASKSRVANKILDAALKL